MDDMDTFDIRSLTFMQLEHWIKQRDQPAFHGRQIFRWLHARSAATYAEMSDLSKTLRADLERDAPLRSIEIVDELQAEDGTIKFCFRLGDNQKIEGVFIPEEERRTLCVSTQVGCGMGCSFCATGMLGFQRNLSAGEIVGQVEVASRRLKGPDRARPVSNIVFMGMGEPLANLEAVTAAVQILLHPNGLGISRRRLTVSTAGLADAMEEFVQRAPVKLAVSLNATNDELRDRIMPINRRFPIAKVLECCRRLPLMRGERITFEYVLLGGQNDSPDHARQLIRLLRGIRAKVNLIPFNPYPGLPFVRPDDHVVEEFRRILDEGDVSVFIRRSRGDSLQAACGQLAAQAR
jgi:23S rRNA (adenine2503-C2)-methyltransferase